MITSHESTAREEICRVSKSVFDRGYVHSTAGNIRVALDEADGVRPSNAEIGHLVLAAV